MRTALGRDCRRPPHLICGGTQNRTTSFFQSFSSASSASVCAALLLPPGARVAGGLAVAAQAAAPLHTRASPITACVVRTQRSCCCVQACTPVQRAHPLEKFSLTPAALPRHTRPSADALCTCQQGPRTSLTLNSALLVAGAVHLSTHALP